MGNYDKRLIAIAVAILILAFAGGSWYGGKKTEKEAKQDELLVLTENMEIDKAEIEVEPITIVVFVTGAVASPGIYTLPEGSRLYEAIDRAGGLLPDAEARQIPMARIIEDEETVYIPVVGEEDEIIATSSINNSSSNKININKANATEIATLDGIGPALSQRIIDYRKSNGPFTDVSEIKNVSGIGDKKYEAIKDKITVK